MFWSAVAETDFFFLNPKMSHCYVYYGVTLCNKIEKFYDRIARSRWKINARLYLWVLWNGPARYVKNAKSCPPKKIDQNLVFIDTILKKNNRLKNFNFGGKKYIACGEKWSKFKTNTYFSPQAMYFWSQMAYFSWKMTFSKTCKGQYY